MFIEVSATATSMVIHQLQPPNAHHGWPISPVLLCESLFSLYKYLISILCINPRTPLSLINVDNALCVTKQCNGTAYPSVIPLQLEDESSYLNSSSPADIWGAMSVCNGGNGQLRLNYLEF